MIYFDNSATTKMDPSVLQTYDAVCQISGEIHHHFIRGAKKLLISLNSHGSKLLI